MYADGGVLENTLPLSVPGLIATGTFAFIFAWTEFIFAVVLTRTDAITLPVAIAGFSGSQGSNWGQASALGCHRDRTCFCAESACSEAFCPRPYAWRGARMNEVLCCPAGLLAFQG